jgi:2-polyprenyl-3-methyl-5-hydroxy-6-metoxy-1,4-benzoquinol methylase
MKFRFAAQTALEWVAIRLGLLPEPMAQAHLYTVLSRAILEANHAGLFAALESGPASVASLAQRLELNERALGTLATCLAAAGYLEHDGQALSLTPMSHKWLTRSSPNSLDDFLRLCLTDWEWISRMGSFLRTGQGVDFHEHYTAVQWRMYQRAMAVGMRRCAQELARRLPVRAGASAMLDIGGGHGLFSAELCRRHARLHSVVLDLPQAVEVAAPLLAAEQLGDRVVHQAGDARTADLGECRLDVVLCANLMHHLTPDQNQDLCRRVTRALTPGG